MAPPQLPRKPLGKTGVETTDRGDVISAQHVIMAVGTLSTPKLPEVPGIDSFKGQKYQTSKWPHAPPACGLRCSVPTASARLTRLLTACAKPAPMPSWLDPAPS